MVGSACPPTGQKKQGKRCLPHCGSRWPEVANPVTLVVVEESLLVAAYDRHGPTAGGHFADDRLVFTTVEELEAQAFSLS